VRGEAFDVIYGCGPEPMLVRSRNWRTNGCIDCQLSLERHMNAGSASAEAAAWTAASICICREGPVLDKAEQTGSPTSANRTRRDGGAEKSGTRTPNCELIEWREWEMMGP
jgi:hypothetical protein